MTNSTTLPPPCADGQHVPAIVHRTGGRDARFDNRCGICGHRIGRDTLDQEWVLIPESSDERLS